MFSILRAAGLYQNFQVNKAERHETQSEASHESSKGHQSYDYQQKQKELRLTTPNIFRHLSLSLRRSKITAAEGYPPRLFGYNNFILSVSGKKMIGRSSSRRLRHSGRFRLLDRERFSREEFSSIKGGNRRVALTEYICFFYRNCPFSLAVRTPKPKPKPNKHMNE